jgi:hypothetical protein
VNFQACKSPSPKYEVRARTKPDKISPDPPLHSALRDESGAGTINLVFGVITPLTSNPLVNYRYKGCNNEKVQNGVDKVFDSSLRKFHFKIWLVHI